MQFYIQKHVISLLHRITSRGNCEGRGLVPSYTSTPVHVHVNAILVVQLHYMHTCMAHIDLSLHACSFSELPECQVTIASDFPIIYQALCLSLSGSFHFNLSVLVAELFLCLAHNPGTHRYLAEPRVTQTLNAVCSKWEESRGSSRKEYCIMSALRYALNEYSNVVGL